MKIKTFPIRSRASAVRGNAGNVNWKWPIWTNESLNKTNALCRWRAKLTLYLLVFSLPMILGHKAAEKITMTCFKRAPWVSLVHVHGRVRSWVSMTAIRTGILTPSLSEKETRRREMPIFLKAEGPFQEVIDLLRLIILSRSWRKTTKDSVGIFRQNLLMLTKIWSIFLVWMHRHLNPNQRTVYVWTIVRRRYFLTHGTQKPFKT